MSTRERAGRSSVLRLLAALATKLVTVMIGAAVVVAAVGAVVVAVVVVGAKPAAAHAELLSTSPAAGDQLESPPAEIALTFSEAVELPEIRLLDADGAGVELEAPTQPSSTTVTVPVPQLADGGYVVAWNAVSADGHPVSGSFTFAIGNGPLPDPSVATSGGQGGHGWGVALGVARSLQYAGIALALGLWGYVVICWWTGRDDRTVRELVIAGAGILAAGSIARIVFQAGYLDTSIRDVLRTEAGRSWFTSAVLALPLGMLGSSLARLLRRPVHGVAVALLAVLLGRSVAAGGHGGTGRAPLLGNVMTVVHVAAMALWLGGIVGVLLCLRRREETAIHRFSSIALALVTVLAASGAVQSVRQLETLDALTSTTFGRALIVKLALVAVLLAVAALGRFVLRSGGLVIQRAGEEDRQWPWQDALRRTVAIEALLAAGVIAVTATLAGASPLSDASTEPVSLALIEGDRTAYISIFPAQVGDNSIHVTIDDLTIQGPDEITVELAPADGSIAPIDVAVAESGPGHVIADAANIPFGGTWTIEVDARYGEFELVTFTGELEVP